MVAEDKFAQDKPRLSLKGVKEVDALRTSSFNHLGEEGVPTLDLGMAFSSEANKLQAAKDLEVVMRDVGFFLVENHGVDQDLRGRMEAAIRKFFHLPLEVKERYPLDDVALRGYVGVGNTKFARSEGFNAPVWLESDNQNLWPEEVPELKTLTLAYNGQVREVGCKLNRLIALRVGYEDDEEFFNREYFGIGGRYPSHQQCCMNFFAKDDAFNAAENAFGIRAHSDFGWLTLLGTDGNPGLQVFSKTGEWIEPEYKKDQLIVNLGDFIKRLTNDTYSSTLHRVQNPKGNERISFPVFFNPFYEITGSVFPKYIKDGEVPKYEPVAFGKYIEAKRKALYVRELNENRRAGN
eukprot:Clim_evm2s89 gene=Clim_evmTU2s89